MKKLITANEFYSLLIGLSISLVLLTSCSTGEATKNSEIRNSNKTFIFRDGQDTYRVEFDGKRITSLYKNEREIPDTEIDNYKDLVEYELKNLTNNLYSTKEKPTRIKIFIDKDKSDNDTTECDEEDFDAQRFFRFKFYDNLLNDKKIELDSLMKYLKNKDFEFYINPDDIREPLLKYKEFFKELPSTEIPDIYKEWFQKEMKKFREQMKHYKLDIDSLETQLRDKMKDFRKGQKKKIEIIELKDESDEFYKSESSNDEFTEELMKDGYLYSSADGFSYRMDEKKSLLTIKNCSANYFTNTKRFSEDITEGI